MNAIIDRIQEQYDSSKKTFKGKIMSGARERATKQYFKDTAARARRKQNKVRFDTFRRDEQSTEEDLRLEDIHFANFLGIKDTVYGVPYNNVNIDEPVNINECDTLLPEEAVVNETVSLDENYNTFKRGHEESALDEEQEAKCARIEELNFEEMVEYMREQIEERNFEEMVEYMREQIRIANQIAANELYNY
jgi:hypothetical protein